MSERRVSLSIGEPDAQLYCQAEAEQFITFTTERKWANAIYRMVRAFKQR